MNCYLGLAKFCSLRRISGTIFYLIFKYICPWHHSEVFERLRSTVKESLFSWDQFFSTLLNDYGFSAWSTQKKKTLAAKERMMMMLRTKLKNKHKCCKVAICKETKLLIQQEEKNDTKVWLSEAHRTSIYLHFCLQQNSLQVTIANIYGTNCSIEMT